MEFSDTYTAQHSTIYLYTYTHSHTQRNPAMTAGSTLFSAGAALGLPRTVLVSHADDPLLAGLTLAGERLHPHSAEGRHLRELLVPTQEVFIHSV